MQIFIWAFSWNMVYTFAIYVYISFVIYLFFSYNSSSLYLLFSRLFCAFAITFTKKKCFSHRTFQRYMDPEIFSSRFAFSKIHFMCITDIFNFGQLKEQQRYHRITIDPWHSSSKAGIPQMLLLLLLLLQAALTTGMLRVCTRTREKQKKKWKRKKKHEPYYFLHLKKTTIFT